MTSGPRTMAVAALLVRAVVAPLAASCRWSWVGGKDHLEAVRSSRGAVIFAFWHRQTLFATQILRRELLPHGVAITLLASQSRDGELAARIGRAWGARLVRGSASRGGRQALIALRREILRHRSSPILISDGPHGPAGVFKPGSVILSQVTGAPILPLGFAVDRCWRLRSWDRLMVPRPFARVAASVAPPQPPTEDRSAEGQERERRRLEQLLHQLEEEAAAALRE